MMKSKIDFYKIHKCILTIKIYLFKIHTTNMEMDPLHLQLFLDVFYKKVRSNSLNNGKNLGKHYCYNTLNNVYKIEKIDLKKCTIAGKSISDREIVDMLIAHFINKDGLRCAISIKFDDYKKIMDEVNSNIEIMSESSLQNYNISKKYKD